MSDTENILSYNRAQTLMVIQHGQEIFVTTKDRQFKSSYVIAVTRRVLHGVGFSLLGEVKDISRPIGADEHAWLTNPSLISMLRSCRASCQ